jgi:hypothetical protein
LQMEEIVSLPFKSRTQPWVQPTSVGVPKTMQTARRAVRTV